MTSGSPLYVELLGADGGVKGQNRANADKALHQLTALTVNEVRK